MSPAVFFAVSSSETDLMLVKVKEVEAVFGSIGRYSKVAELTAVHPLSQS